VTKVNKLIAVLVLVGAVAGRLPTGWMIYVSAARKLPGSAKSIMRYSFPINLDRAGKLTPSPSVLRRYKPAR